MTATLEEIFDNKGSNGSPAAETVIDGLGHPRMKFKTADNPTIDVVNPIPKPEAGVNRSFWKQIYLKCSVAPSTQCDNFKWFCDGPEFGTGIAFKVGNETPTKTKLLDTGYEVATGTVGESGDEMVAAHAGLNGSSNVFGYTSASPKSISCSEAGNVINATGETTNYIVLQVEVGISASAGTPANTVLNWRWDEI